MTGNSTWAKTLLLSVFNGLVAALCVAFIPYRPMFGLISISAIVLLACFLSIWLARRVTI